MDGYTTQERAAFAARLEMAVRAFGHGGRKRAADAIGVSGSAINAYYTGTGNPPAPRAVFALEEALELAPGELSKLLGYKRAEASGSPPCTIEYALSNDPSLTKDERNHILGTYQMFRGRHE